MKFDCTGCGACCTRVGENHALLKKMGFPFDLKEDGRTCEKFDSETRKCTVYRNRPDVCNVSTMYYKLHSKNGKTKKKAYLEEATLCNRWMDQDGIDVRKRIDLTQYQ